MIPWKTRENKGSSLDIAITQYFYPLTYDENGNLTQRKTAQGPVNYTWDARNRLTRAGGRGGF